jgi:hypothetical protein
MTGNFNYIFAGIATGITKKGDDDLVELPVAFDKQAYMEGMRRLGSQIFDRKKPVY